MEQKLHLSLYTFSQEDYKQAALIWNGPHPDDGQECYVVEGAMEGYPVPDLAEEPQLNAPDGDEIDTQMFADMAKKMGIKHEY